MELIKSFWPEGKPIRTITITGTHLVPEDEAFETLTLFEDDKKENEKRKKLESLEHIMDKLKKKYGDNVGNLRS